MSRDLRQLLHDTATQPTRPVDTTAVVSKARSQARATRAAATVAVIVAIVGAGIGVRTLLDRPDGRAPEILDQPGEPSPSGSPVDPQAHVLFFRGDGLEYDVESYVLVGRESDRPLETTREELAFALHELVRGPTEGERDQGMRSVFSSRTADIVNNVSVSDGHAVVDFRRLRESISQLSTTGVSTGFMIALKGTVFAVEAVDSVEFTLDGDCEAFWESIESSCEVVTRADWEQTLDEHGTPSGWPSRDPASNDVGQDAGT